MMKPRQMDGNEAKPRILTGIWLEDQRVVLNLWNWAGVAA